MNSFTMQVFKNVISATFFVVLREMTLFVWF